MSYEPEGASIKAAVSSTNGDSRRSTAREFDGVLISIESHNDLDGAVWTLARIVVSTCGDMFAHGGDTRRRNGMNPDHPK